MVRRLEFLTSLRMRGRPAAAGVMLLGVLALSLAVFLLAPGVRVRRTLFFPGAGSRGLATEIRAVPRHRDAERSARELVDAVLLGPRRPDADAVFARGTTARVVMLRRGVLYVDLDAPEVLPTPAAPLTLPAAVAMLQRTLRFNLRGVREVACSVNGQQLLPF